MLRLLRIWPSLGGSCASLESLDLSVYGSLGRHKNPLERAQILNSPRWVWIISHNPGLRSTVLFRNHGSMQFIK